MDPASIAAPRRVHLTRLMSIWRSAGWPCRDAVEIDLLAARWVELRASERGHETLHLTAAGIEQLAQARSRNQRANSAHDRLAERIARHLADTGRIVWRELALRAQGDAAEPGWRIARPDVYSLRNTTVEAYLQPMVHEVKVSRADLQSDLRHTAKRESYRWLASETYYVFPAGIAEVDEIPDAYGVWLWHPTADDDDGDDGRLELARSARHTPCPLPFAVWMALAKAAPFVAGLVAAQGQL